MTTPNDHSESVFVRYGIAALAVMLTVIAHLLLEEVWGGQISPALFLPGVLASLFYGGVGPGYLAAALATGALIAFADGGAELLRVGISAVGFVMACALVQARESRMLGSLNALSEAASAATDAIVRLNRFGRVASADDRAMAIFASSPEGMRNRPVLELVMPEDREALAKALRRCWHEGRVDVDVRVLWRGTAPHDMHLTLSRAESMQGRPAEVFCFMKDISQRQRELEELRQSRERLEVAFRHGIVGMTVSDMNGAWLEVNPAFCEMLGYRPDELIQRQYDAITHRDDITRDKDIRRQFASGEMDHCVIEKRFTSRSGQTVWARVSHEVVHDQDGKPAYVVSQVQELSLA